MIESLERRLLWVAKPDAIHGFTFDFTGTDSGGDLFDDSPIGRFELSSDQFSLNDVDLNGGPDSQGTYRYKFSHSRSFDRALEVRFAEGRREVILDFNLKFSAVNSGLFRVEYEDSFLEGDFTLSPQPGRGDIRGRVVIDDRGDEMLDAFDEGLAGIRVYIDRNNDGKWNRGKELSRFTDENGYYVFKNHTAGFHTVRCGLLEKYRFSVPGGPAYVLTLSPGEIERNVSFGQTRTVKITGFTYLDSNGNGAFDRNEDSSGGLLYLDLNDDGNQDPLEPAGDRVGGKYTFFGLAAGTYVVRVQHVTQGQTLSSPAQGSYVVTLKPGTISKTLTFISR